jgi:hypothetical protein
VNTEFRSLREVAQQVLHQFHMAQRANPVAGAHGHIQMHHAPSTGK